MNYKNTSRILGPIEADIVARLTYEKKLIITTKDLDGLFKLSPEAKEPFKKWHSFGG